MKHELPPLPYAYHALEPYVSAKLMEIHHDKHHAAYVAKLNEVVEATPALQEKSVEELLARLSSIAEGPQKIVRNFGGGHYNHSFFWKVMGPPAEGAGGGEATGDLAAAIARDFGSFASFREQFTKIANTVFGSGWTWLVADKAGKLSIISTPNQDCPLSMGLTPVTTLDEWEHAYYLDYLNKRPDYVEAFWSIANWKQAEENYRQIGDRR